MFRVTAVRFAESVSKHPLNLREASAALLPPLPYVIVILDIGRRQLTRLFPAKSIPPHTARAPEPSL